MIPRLAVALLILSAQPGVWAALPESCYLEDFDLDPGPGGDLSGWTVFNGGAAPLDWGTTDDGFCGSGNWTPGNYTGGSGAAACVDSDAAGTGVVNAYLCSPQLLIPGGDTDPELRFDYNFQVFSATGEDALEVLIGTTQPDLSTIAGYTSVFLATDNAGVLQGAGASERLDVSEFAGLAVYICFRYGADFDWYAQVDDVETVSSQCFFHCGDCDGIPDSVDNCIIDSNPAQEDTNGDGIGNVCDADIAGPAGPGADDCAVNFFDLARMKSVFFTDDPDADLVGLGNTRPDGVVDFSDLGRMKELFLRPPGPSATGCN